MKWRRLNDKSNQFAGNELHRKHCFVILEKEEFTCVPMNELEFVEVLEIGEESYLHGVRIIDESYGEDIYLPVEVVRC